MSVTKAIFLADPVSFIEGDSIDYVYGPTRVQRIAEMVDLYSEQLTVALFRERLAELSDVEVIFSCWGMPALSDADLDALPNLKAVFYASGSVQYFAAPFLNRGIVVCSAAAANAVPVAEFCLGQILLSCKGMFSNQVACRRGPWNHADLSIGRGVYGESVALLGVGEISRSLLHLLQPFNLRVLAASGYLSRCPEQAQSMGIDAIVDVETAFSEALIVSNHLADRPGTEGMLNEMHFLSMRQGATFINTGRGAQVDEAGLIRALKQRPDLTALLDVQYPEPPDASSELYSLPNIHMTSHIAGSMNDEVRRMADFMISDFKRWQAGEALQYQVAPESILTRA
ncbi:hydroxyacid dehydrogenase [Coraliomargarita sp. W4R72]